MSTIERDIEISPKEAFALQRQDAMLVDVRDAGELFNGSPVDARNIPVTQLAASEFDGSRIIILMCASGVRSLEAAKLLVKTHTAPVYSVTGGFAEWCSSKLPVDHSSSLDEQSRERYMRQLILPEVGIEGQRRLSSGRVLVIGAGGLGSPVLTYLASAGVGVIGIVDDDRVDRSNLQRQILHRDDRVGQLKTESAKVTLEAINPQISVQLHTQRLNIDNAARIIGDYDIVIDGSDNLETRYAVSDACVQADKPLIYGAVLRFEGQVSVFWPGRNENPCYRCLFPDVSDATDGPNCAEAGVLGVVPAVIGSLQATEALKILLNTGELLTGRLIRYDALSSKFTEAKVRRDKSCSTCGNSRQHH